MILKSEKGAIPIILVILAVAGVVAFLAIGGLKNLQPGFSWCKEGNNFQLKGSKSKEIGNGCLVYRIKLSSAMTELCFGSKIKNVDNEKFEVAAPKPPVSKDDLTGSEWNYTIQSGGGVGGVMTFDKGAKGDVSGTFTENGPDGQKKKNFKGNFDGDKLTLTMEDFPTFSLMLVSGGTGMNGKPKNIDPKQGISYPDDFFHAARIP